MIKEGGKRGQITIFIIIAILIVGAVILLFLFMGRLNITPPGKIEQNPDIFLTSCIEPSVREAVTIISKQGGYINASLYKEFNGEKISYLCYTNNNYFSCINQEPMLIQHLKAEIKKRISGNVEKCFQDMKQDLESKGWSVTMNSLTFDVELMPKKVLVNMNRNIVLSKSDQTFRYEKFNSVISSRFYDLAIVVQEITSQEARFCNFEQLGFMLFYPQFNIDKFRTGDGTTIYTVADRRTQEKFRFAVRSCVIPPGF